MGRWVAWIDGSAALGFAIGMFLSTACGDDAGEPPGDGGPAEVAEASTMDGGASDAAEPVDASQDGSDGGARVPRDLTFFVWGDLHVDPGVANMGHLAAVEGAQDMVGRPYPDPIGGAVADPEFVLDVGDAVDWPTAAATQEFARMLVEDVPWPVWPVLGNHDLTEAGSPTFENWFLGQFTESDARFPNGAVAGADVGERSYSFMHGGVAFVGLSHSYDVGLGSSSQPIWPADRAWLAAELARFPPDTPIVVWLHLGITAIEEVEELTAVLRGHRVVLVAGGHYHFPFLQRVDGFDFVQVGSPRPSEANAQVNVAVRITDDALTAAFFDYEHGTWREDLVLSKPLAP